MPNYIVKVSEGYYKVATGEFVVEAENKAEAEVKVSEMYDQGELELDEEFGLGDDPPLFQIEDVERI